MNFDMSPYGAFIWPAYGVTVLLLGGAALWTWLRWRAARAKLAALEPARPGPPPDKESKP